MKDNFLLDLIAEETNLGALVATKRDLFGF